MLGPALHMLSRGRILDRSWLSARAIAMSLQLRLWARAAATALARSNSEFASTIRPRSSAASRVRLFSHRARSLCEVRMPLIFITLSAPTYPAACGRGPNLRRPRQLVYAGLLGRHPQVTLCVPDFTIPQTVTQS